MKKLFSLIAALGLVFSSTLWTYAADNATVTITVTISHSRDIEVGGSANLTVNPGETKIGGAITVKNVGSGVDEAITVANQTQLPTGWTLKFHFTDANTAPQANSQGWADAPTKTIARDATAYLWIKLGVPNPTINANSQAISIKISAS